MRKILLFILAVATLFFNVSYTVLADEMSTFDILYGIEDDFIIRLTEYGLEKEEIKSFIDDMDEYVDGFQASIYEQDLDAYFITIFLQTLQKEEHIPVLIAFDAVYQEEILYMLETRLVPECMEQFKMTMFYDKLIYELPGVSDEVVEDEEKTVVVTPEVQLPPEKPLPFTDISEYPWAIESIVYLYENNVVSGTGEGLYSPDKPVTREEFLKMVVSALLKTNSMYDKEFGKRAKDTWYHSYFAAAEFYALIQGIYEEDTFESGVYITRQDMSTIAYRAALRADIVLPDITYSTDFMDKTSCSYYSIQAIKELQEADIIHGKGNSMFEPNSTTTRAEAAKIIHNLMILR